MARPRRIVSLAAASVSSHTPAGFGACGRKRRRGPESGATRGDPERTRAGDGRCGAVEKEIGRRRRPESALFHTNVVFECCARLYFVTRFSRRARAGPAGACRARAAACQTAARPPRERLQPGLRPSHPRTANARRRSSQRSARLQTRPLEYAFPTKRRLPPSLL